MIVHREYQQKSVEWSIARSKMPTASELGQIITPNFAIRKGDMFQTYLNKKLAEMWSGGPLIGFNTFDVEQGNILEDEARPWLAGMLEKDLEAVGFITNDAGNFGCSPDGWNEEGKWGAEIKAPAVHTHVGYLRDGGLPDEYGPQVHGSMFATGAEKWVFFSYRRGLPKLTVLVHRDLKIIDKIEEAVEEFQTQFATGWEKLCALNGGPPKRKEYRFQPKPNQDPNDIPTP